LCTFIPFARPGGRRIRSGQPGEANCDSQFRAGTLHLVFDLCGEGGTGMSDGGIAAFSRSNIPAVSGKKAGWNRAHQLNTRQCGVGPENYENRLMGVRYIRPQKRLGRNKRRASGSTRTPRTRVITGHRKARQKRPVELPFLPKTLSLLRVAKLEAFLREENSQT